MQDVSGYAVVNLHATDATVHHQYEKGFFPMLKKHGGEFVTFDDAAFTLEGAAPRSGRLIIFKFPSAARYRGPGGSVWRWALGCVTMWLANALAAIVRAPRAHAGHRQGSGGLRSACRRTRRGFRRTASRPGIRRPAQA